MSGMTSIIRTVTRIVVGVIFIYGIYIITHGHLTPGGGFAGGALIAGAMILLVLSYGTDSLHLKSKEAGSSLMESLSILAFLVLAIGGLLLGVRVFFNNYLPKGNAGDLWSGGVIPLYNIAVGMEVAAALFTIFLALVIYKEEIRT